MSTAIEWTDETWNPIAGCSKVSEGCRNCYAMRLSHRLAHMGQEKYRGLTQKTAAGVNWTGQLAFDEKALLKPLSWKKPRRIFVNSMSDLFHENVKEEWIDQIFAVMALCPQHTFQVLTKRPERMAQYMDLSTDNREEDIGRAMRDIQPSDPGLIELPLPNVWLGASVENQATADERIPHLLKTPAAVRFLSCEPLLGAVNVSEELHAYRIRKGLACAAYSGNALSDIQPRIDWVIVGGESGPGARPMHPDWVRSLRDQCHSDAVPFFFKQWGEFGPVDSPNAVVTFQPTKPGNIVVGFAKVGKKAAGRSLDGRTWDEFPKSSEQ